MQKFESWLGQADRYAGATGRPMVSLCYAQSLDGSLTIRRGQSTPISGPETQRITHHLRALHEVILIGCGTVLADDPSLTVRLIGGNSPQPLILDSRLRTPPGARVIAGHPRPAWIATGLQPDPARREALEASGATIFTLPTDTAGQVDLGALLDCLGERGVQRLMVEGGARVITRFLALDFAQLASITIAPVFLGGLASVETTLAGMPRFREVDYQRVGEDLVVWGRFIDF